MRPEIAFVEIHIDLVVIGFERQYHAQRRQKSDTAAKGRSSSAAKSCNPLASLDAVKIRASQIHAVAFLQMAEAFGLNALYLYQQTDTVAFMLIVDHGDRRIKVWILLCPDKHVGTQLFELRGISARDIQSDEAEIVVVIHDKCHFTANRLAPGPGFSAIVDQFLVHTERNGIRTAAIFLAPAHGAHDAAAVFRELTRTGI